MAREYGVVGMKKWWGALLLAVSLLLLPEGICFGEGASPERGRVLRVGYVPDTGFIEEDWPGHFRGYGYEYMEFLANYGNWVFEYVPSTTWMECAAKLQSGEIDLLPEMPGNYRILQNVKRTDHVIGRLAMELVVNPDGMKPNMRLGTYDSSYPIPHLKSVAEGEGFTYELTKYPLFYDMQEAFDRGELDGYVGPMLHPQEGRHVLEIFDRQSYRLLVRADQEELLRQMNLAMDQMLLYQSNIRESLNEKYMRRGGFPLILNRAEREYLQEKQKLRTVIFNEHHPYAFFEDGKMQGVIPEILTQISEDLGVEIEIVHPDSRDEAERLIRSGQVDFVADAICDFSWAHGHNMRPTQFYLDLEYVPVARKGERIRDTSRVACVEELLYTKNYIEPLFSAERRLYVSSLEEGFRAVSEGKADIIFAPQGEVNYLMEATGSYHLEAGSESDFSELISLGVSRNADTRLWQVLNKEINHLDQDKIRSIINRTEQSTGHFSIRWMIYHYPLQSLFVLAVLGAIVILGLWFRFRMRRSHMAVVQHMAYTDMRYDLPNLVWLEKEVPGLLRQKREDYQAGRLYGMVLSMGSTAAMTELYGRELLDSKLKELAAGLGSQDWVLLTATGRDAGHLACICRGENTAQMQRSVAGAIAKYGYLATNDTRIWLHMHAGLCPLRPGGEFIQTMDRAAIACGELRGSYDEVRMFDEQLQERLVLEQQIESHMEQALAAGEFHAWYQPKYDIRTRKIVGAEALVRWISGEMGFMPPGKFIPLFEKNGFVVSVDYAILEQAFEFQQKRLAEGKPVMPISVNQSRLHMTEEGYLEKMRAIVEKYRIPKGLIELEVTETVFGDFDQEESQKNAANIVRGLHEMGFSVSVDDFGSGYSSFMLLNYLPLDVMKIDRSLLTSSEDSQRMRDILGNVIRLGKTLHMQVICEGIETEEQEKLLLELGCHFGQGYLNGKPMKEADFEEYLEGREIGHPEE